MGRNTDADADIRAFLLDAPREKLYSELAREVVERFGAERAWSRQQIFELLNERDVRRVQVSPIYRDPEVRDFIEDRLGQWTLKEIHEACRKRFGKSRAPSRSAIHRHWVRMRS